MSLSLPILLAGIPLAVISHEAGHALVGTLAGMPPRIINLGLGPTLWTGRWRTHLIILRVFLIQGYVQTVWRPNRSRLSKMAFAIGGVMGNFAAFGVFSAIAAMRTEASPVCATLAAAQGYVAMLTLIPWPSRIDGQRSGSDGLQFLGYLFKSSTDAFPGIYRKLVAAVDPDAAEGAVPSCDIAEALIMLNRFGTAKALWERRYWLGCLRDQIYDGALSSAERVLVLEQVLSHELANRRGDVTQPELDSWSNEIVALSDNPAYRVTRSGVLVMLGRAAEARALLLSLSPAGMKPLQQLGCAVFRSQASAALGEFEASAAEAEQARRIARLSADPSNLHLAETLLAFRKMR